METLTMSSKERKRLVVMAGVRDKKLSLKQASELMGIGYRQSKRVWSRFQLKGDAGLVHRGRGRSGSRCKPAKLRHEVMKQYQERYPDFGPTLAAEKLREKGFEVDHETLRRWLLREGLWERIRRGQPHRSRRERKECFGQMVQMDGSHHDWFEGRRENAVLMVMIDDATNEVNARFFEGETTEAAYGVFEMWVDRYGLPGSLYVDRDSIYRCDREPTIAEQMAGIRPTTQFGRVMVQIGVQVIMAHSPQAKGRVERCNGVLQDRLVKEMRLEGISDLESANKFLEKEYLPRLNAKFRLDACSTFDAHRPNEWDLKETLNWEEERVVAKDWTVLWKGRCLQIQAEEGHLGLAGKKVTVRMLRSGTLKVIYKGKTLRSKELPGQPQKEKPEPRKVGRVEMYKPEKNHPWRRLRIGRGKEFGGEENKEMGEENRARAHSSAASASPSLRSDSATAAEE